jgi:hypothetical protein
MNVRPEIKIEAGADASRITGLLADLHRIFSQEGMRAGRPKADAPPVSVPAALLYEIGQTLRESAAATKIMRINFAKALAIEPGNLIGRAALMKAITVTAPANIAATTKNIETYERLAREVETLREAAKRKAAERADNELLHRYFEIASLLDIRTPVAPGEAMTHKLLIEAAEIERKITAAGRNIPLAAQEEIACARGKRLAGLRDQYAETFRQISEESPQRRTDIASEIEALGGQVPQTVTEALGGDAAKAVDVTALMAEYEQTAAEVIRKSDSGTLDARTARDARARLDQIKRNIAPVTITNTSAEDAAIVRALAAAA